MKRAFLLVPLLLMGVPVANGKPPQMMTLPKDWSSSKPAHAPTASPGGATYLGDSGQPSLDLAGKSLIAKQTEAITALDARLKKLETRIKELESQVAGSQK